MTRSSFANSASHKTELQASSLRHMTSLTNNEMCECFCNRACVLTVLYYFIMALGFAKMGFSSTLFYSIDFWHGIRSCTLGEMMSQREGRRHGLWSYPHTPTCTPTRTHHPGPYLPRQTNWEQFRQGRSQSGRSEGVVPTSQDDKGGWSTLWREARIWIRFGQHSVSTNSLIPWH